MRNSLVPLAIIFIVFIVLACSDPPPTIPEAIGETSIPSETSESAFTQTPEPTGTETAEPSLTATPAPLPLEIMEWAVYPIANLVDPRISDTRVEILVRNPNGFPVNVNRDKVELRLLNAAGEIVYVNQNPVLYIWEGSWILADETVPISVCACFETDGVEKQTWESLELVAPLEEAEGIVYTFDVEATLGEFFYLDEAHLGGHQLGAWITLVNTSDQELRSFEVRVTARDTSGNHVGVVVSGSFSDRENPRIPPGASADGIIVSEIDYFNQPLQYEIVAIGIPAY